MSDLARLHDELTTAIETRTAARNQCIGGQPSVETEVAYLSACQAVTEVHVAYALADLKQQRDQQRYWASAITWGGLGVIVVATITNYILAK